MRYTKLSLRPKNSRANKPPFKSKSKPISNEIVKDVHIIRIKCRTSCNIYSLTIRSGYLTESDVLISSIMDERRLKVEGLDLCPRIVIRGSRILSLSRLKSDCFIVSFSF